MTCVRAAVSAPIFPSTGVQTEATNPAAKSALRTQEPKNEMFVLMPSRRRQSLTTAPGLFGLAREVPADSLS